MKKPKQIIVINHIGYTIKVFDIKDAQNDVLILFQSGVRAIAKDRDKMNGEIYLTFPIKSADYATIGHEIIHIMQYICRSRGIEFTEELEHIAYMWHYVFNEIRGFHYTLK